MMESDPLICLMMPSLAVQKKSLDDILGLSRDANVIDIGLAYERRKAELQRASPQDPSAIALAHQAHEILSNPKRRAAYDASLVTQAEKAAAAEQAAPDLVLEGDEDEKPARNKYLIGGIAVAVAAIVAAFVVLRPGHDRPPPPPPPVVEAPKPPPPPPPKPLGPEQILPAAMLSVGRVMSYEMSGRAVPVGLALAVEPTRLIPTGPGIPPGGQLG